MARGKEQASIREIANQLELSIATVSRALNGLDGVSDETRLRVQRVADEMGYERHIAERQRRVIGLLYGGEQIRTQWGGFDSEVLSGIREATEARGWDLTLLSASQRKGSGESFRQFLRYRNVPGVIVRSIQPTPVTAVQIAREGIPSVMLGNRSEDPGMNFACTDMRGHVGMLMDHFIAQGHRRIGLSIHGVVDHDMRERHEAYVEAHARHGLVLGPDLVVQASELGSPRVGARAIDRLLQMEDPPTAVFLTDPLSTLGALQRCLALGIRAPGELSIAGVDDGQTRFITHPVYTAVCQDGASLGRNAARWLIDTLTGRETMALRLSQSATIAIHDTTGPAPARAVRLNADGRRLA